MHREIYTTIVNSKGIEKHYCFKNNLHFWKKMKPGLGQPPIDGGMSAHRLPSYGDGGGEYAASMKRYCLKTFR